MVRKFAETNRPKVSNEVTRGESQSFGQKQNFVRSEV